MVKCTDHWTHGEQCRMPRFFVIWEFLARSLDHRRLQIVFDVLDLIKMCEFKGGL